VPNRAGPFRPSNNRGPSTPPRLFREAPACSDVLRKQRFCNPPPKKFAFKGFPPCAAGGLSINSKGTALSGPRDPLRPPGRCLFRPAPFPDDKSKPPIFRLRRPGSVFPLEKKYGFFGGSPGPGRPPKKTQTRARRPHSPRWPIRPGKKLAHFFFRLPHCPGKKRDGPTGPPFTILQPPQPLGCRALCKRLFWSTARKPRSGRPRRKSLAGGPRDRKKPLFLKIRKKTKKKRLFVCLRPFYKPKQKPGPPPPPPGGAPPGPVFWGGLGWWGILRRGKGRIVTPEKFSGPNFADPLARKLFPTPARLLFHLGRKTGTIKDNRFPGWGLTMAGGKGSVSPL